MDGICSSGGRNSGGVPQRNASGASKTRRFSSVFFVFYVFFFKDIFLFVMSFETLDVLVVLFVPVAILVPGSGRGLWNRRGTLGSHFCHCDIIVL